LKNLAKSLGNTLNAVNKTKLISTIVIVLFLASVVLVAMPPVKAALTITSQSPAQTGYVGPTSNADPTTGKVANYTVIPIAYISASPNPIGVGQTLLVNMWITFPSGEGKFMNGYSVKVTEPSGTIDTVSLQSYVADGTAYFTMTPDQTGIYAFQFSFAGEYYPAGYYSNGVYSATFVSGWIYNPSDYVMPATSQIWNETVQTNAVSSWDGLMYAAGQSTPTGYWSRPIEPNNRNWAYSAGNWPSPYFGNIANTQATNSWHDEWYGPYVPAVNTPHILWSEQSLISGIIGGDTGTQANVVGPSSSGVINTPSVIYNGRCYTTVTKSLNGGAPMTYAECYDLQTGHIYYDILYYTNVGGTGITPTLVTYWSGTDTSVPGASADAAYGVDLFTIVSGAANMSNAFLIKINPNTGAVTANITLPFLTRTGTVTQTIPGSPSSYSVSSDIPNFFFQNGYFLSYQWVNSTTSIFDGVSVTLAYNGYLVNWTEQGGTTTVAGSTQAQIATTFKTRMVSNVSVTLPESFRTIYEPNFGYGYGAFDPSTGISVTQNRFLAGGFYGDSFIATSLVTGKVLWNVSSAPGEQVDAYRPTNGWCRDGLYVYEAERGFINALNLKDGSEAWNCTISDANTPTQYPWGIFWMYDESAYGHLLYAVGYTGVWAINETNGAIAWHYADPAPAFETPYTTYNNGTYTSEYSVQDIRVMGTGGADGIVYVSNNEHTPTLPPERGWGLIALNATTGDFLWKVMGTRMSVAAASDGYIVAGSNYDGKLYVLGAGPSQTTVSAPQTAVTSGTPSIISGTVLDESPNQPGTPCVSDASMATWMDHLNMQMPFGGIYGNATVTGVPVSLNAVDPNGNLITLGTATSDMSGHYSFIWTPTTTGTYTISATFAGSNAYGSSSSETSAVVVSAPVASSTPAPTSNTGLATTSDLATYIVVAIVVMLIALAIVAVLILRKH
jgi:hypothetical protein